MPFKLIKGAFRVAGLSPDGDSIRFVPDDPSLVHQLPGPFDPNPRPTAQLRLEGIDTLETHYAGREQPDRWSHPATDRLFEFAGITNVVWDAQHKNVVSANDMTRGWILSRAREKNRRPVAFLFAGESDREDGSSVRLTPALLRESYNFVAMAEGLAYPTYYQALFSDLRVVLSDAAGTARTEGRGLWPEDGTNAGFDAVDLSVLTDRVPILPKLFRRLSDFMAASGSAVGFKAALEAAQEPVLDLRDQNFTHFDTFIDQPPGSTRIRLTVPPEMLVFDPMPARPTNNFALMIGAPISGET
jgi:endonuclease YncB( thermonuclease family)